jgi:folate-dependent phosphoribosylglycinamide formyltransferase PurN
MIRIVVLAPIHTSLYSRLVVHLAAQESDMEIAGVIVRMPWSWTRIRGELRRDGARLAQKVVNKWLLADQLPAKEDETESLATLAHQVELPRGTLKDICANHMIPYYTVKDHNDVQSLILLTKIKPDVIAFTGGGLIRKDVLSIPTIGVLNCHSGMLPHYRGMDVVEWALAEEHFDQVGQTLHLMDSGVDTGPILLQCSLELHQGDTITSIRTRLEARMPLMMLEGLRGLRDGTLKPQPQRPEDGRQYFVMHPQLRAMVERKLTDRNP